MVHVFKQEPSERTCREIRSHRHITRHDTQNSTEHPERDKLGGPIQFLDVWSNHPQAEHVDEQVRQIHVKEHRRHETPPLMVRRGDQVIQFSAIRREYWFTKALPQNARIHFARLPHQQKYEKVRDEQDDGEFIRTRENRAREADGLAIRSTISLRRRGLVSGCGAADGALRLSRAYDGPATTAHRGPPGSRLV